MPDFTSCSITWTAHALQRAAARGIAPLEAEAIIRESRVQEQTRQGRWIVWGCVSGWRTKIVLRPVANLCFVVTLIKTAEPCT